MAATLLGVILLAQLLPTNARSGELDDDLSTCTTINCEAVVVGGTINQHTWNLSGGSTATIPRIGAGSWVMSVRAGLNECLRLDVLSQSTLMKMVVVSPSGVIWRNNGRGGTTGCRNCPLIKIASTAQSGYYVVHVGHRYLATDGTFKLAYGRYDKGNPNCAGASLPLQ